MNTAIINIRIDSKTKKSAQKAARDMGLSLSDLVKGYLRNVSKTKRAAFEASEEPSEYLIKMLEESEKEIRKGWVSPSFSNSKDAIAWLRDPKAKYVCQLHKEVQKRVR